MSKGEAEIFSVRWIDPAWARKPVSHSVSHMSSQIVTATFKPPTAITRGCVPDLK